MLELRKIINPHAISESMAKLETEKVFAVLKRASALRNQTLFDRSLLNLLFLDVSADKSINELEVEGAITEMLERASKLPLAKTVNWERVVDAFHVKSRDFDPDDNSIIRSKEPSLSNMLTDVLYTLTRSGDKIKGDEHYLKAMPVSRIEMVHEYFGVDLANQKDQHGIPLIIYLVSSNLYHAADVDDLVKLGVNLNATDQVGKCALVHAFDSRFGSKFGVDDVFKEVLKHSDNLSQAADCIAGEFKVIEPDQAYYHPLAEAKFNQALSLISMEIKSRSALLSTQNSEYMTDGPRRRVSI